MQKSSKYYLRLLSYMKPYKARFGLGLLLMGISSGMEPLIPILLQPLLDGEFNPKDGSTPWVIGVVLVAIVFARGFISYWANYFMNWLSNQVVLDLRRQMFERILALPIKTVDAAHSSQIINKVMHDVANVMGATTTVLNSLVRDSIVLIGLLAWLFWLNWQLTLVFLVAMPIAGAVIRKFSIKMRNFSLRSMEVNSDLLRILQECVEGYRMVKIYGGQKFENDRFDDAAKVWKKQQMRIGNTQAVIMPVAQVIASFALAFVIVVAAHQTAQGMLTVGSMMSYLAAALMIMPAIRRISGVASVLQRGIAAAQSVFEIIDKPIEDLAYKIEAKNIDEKEKSAKSAVNNTQADKKIMGDIEFNDLSFYYPERETHSLKNINLKIKHGESVALVGASGSGKSTIASLICAFYREYDGSLMINGEELSTIDLYKLRSNIAIVTQEVKLFDDTIRANIAYGELVNKSEEEVIEALRSAYALDFVNEMTDGLDTQIGERGVRLSGGQRQRLAIARAILKNSPILILDEATSALDSESEIIVQKAINNLMANRTTIVIAHRLATIHAVSRIVVLEQGCVIEEGNHQQLIDKDGTYAKYYKMQSMANSQ